MIFQNFTGQIVHGIIRTYQTYTLQLLKKEVHDEF